jgi:hypothetical protein
MSIPQFRFIASNLRAKLPTHTARSFRAQNEEVRWLLTSSAIVRFSQPLSQAIREECVLAQGEDYRSAIGHLTFP